MLKERSQIHANNLMTRVALVAACLIVSQLPLSIEGQYALKTMNRQSFESALSGAVFGSTLNTRGRTSPSILNVWSNNGPPLRYGGEGEYVSSVAVDPNNGRIVYAGSDHSKFGIGSVYKSTDAGENWTEFDQGLPDRPVWRLAVDPFKPTLVYAVVYEGPAGNGLYKSTDGGEQWYRTNVPGDQVNMFAIAPSNSNIIYAASEDSPFIFRVSTDRGATWDVLPLAVPPVYPYGALTVHPQNPSMIYASGYGAACRSLDGGRSWTCNSYGGAPSAKTWSFAIDPKYTNVIYAATDDGVFKSVNKGESWVRLGINTVPAYAVAIDPRDHNRVYVGVYFGGVYKSTDGGGTWSPFNDGMGFASVSDLAFDGAGVFLHANGGGVFDVQVRDPGDFRNNR